MAQQGEAGVREIKKEWQIVIPEGWVGIKEQMVQRCQQTGFITQLNFPVKLLDQQKGQQEQGRPESYKKNLHGLTHSMDPLIENTSLRANQQFQKQGKNFIHLNAENQNIKFKTEKLRKNDLMFQDLNYEQWLLKQSLSKKRIFPGARVQMNISRCKIQRNTGSQADMHSAEDTLSEVC